MNTVMTTMNENTDKKAGKPAGAPHSHVQVQATPRKKIKLPAYEGLRPAARERHKVLPAWASATLVLIGFLAAGAFIADVFVLSKKAAIAAPADRAPAAMLLAISTATNRYVDPQNRFSIAVPNGWTASYGDTNVEYDAKLIGPDRISLQVIVGDAPLETLENLKKTFAGVEQETMRNTHIEDMTFRGQPAISRYCRLEINALRSVDFLFEHRSFHLMALIPCEIFESHRTVLDALMETIQPVSVR